MSKNRICVDMKTSDALCIVPTYVQMSLISNDENIFLNFLKVVMCMSIVSISRLFIDIS